YGDRRLEAGLQCRQVVPAFRHGYHPPVTMPVGCVAERLRQHRVTSRRQAHSRERIPLVCVEARRNHHELGFELIDHWNDERVEDIEKIAISRARLERDIQRETCALPSTYVCG